MSANHPKRALLIAGPTASGKSALAVKLARERNGVIINADSMQVYRELRILSARPSPEEERLAPHRLFGHVQGATAYSTAAWLGEAEAAITACWQAGELPIICGGTGLYFKALLQGLAPVPAIPAEVRAHWRIFKGDLHAELQSRDKETAERLQPTDQQRLIRALEVFDGTGKSLSAWQKLAASQSVLQDASVERIFVYRDRSELHARAERRFDMMVEEGALEEVRALPAFDPAQPVMKAIGVRELLAHLRGECDLEQAKSRAKAASRQYIKRQVTWWRGQMKDWQTMPLSD